MNQPEREICNLAIRLERLERSNRRLRLCLFGLAAAAGCLIALGAAQPVPQLIKAHKFELVGADGSSMAELRVSNLGESQLFLHDNSGSASIMPNGFGIYPAAGADVAGGIAPRTWIGPSSLSLSSADNKYNLHFDADSGGDRLLALVPDADAPNSLYPAIEITATSVDQAQIQVGTDAGFRTIIGSTSLFFPSTGETHQTSNASMTLFGKGEKGKLIWRAPN